MKIWEMVKAVEEEKGAALTELGRARATMIVNYGDWGRTREGLIELNETLTIMIMKVCDFYEAQLKKRRGEG
jgi:hypothetical protein